MLAVVVLEIAVVVMGKGALVVPAATVTLPLPTCAEGLSLDRVTIAPPEGAAVESVTVPVEEFPPTTVEGFRTTEAIGPTLALNATTTDDSCTAADVVPLA